MYLYSSLIIWDRVLEVELLSQRLIKKNVFEGDKLDFMTLMGSRGLVGCTTHSAYKDIL